MSIAELEMPAKTHFPSGVGVLVVEDEPNPRRELVRALRKREGYTADVASDGKNAIGKARAGKACVVLMDIVLGGEIDGITAAEKIQQIQPLTSFIFVSAFTSKPEYLERVQKSHVRVGGWIEKPIRETKKLDEISQLINKESQKLHLLARSEQARDRLSYIHGLADGDRTLPREIVNEVIKELSDAKHGKPQKGYKDEGEPNMAEIAAEIDNLYGMIRDLVVERQGDPGLGEALRPLRARLRKLQEVEADELERRYRARVRFDPARSQRLLDRAAKLLAKEP